MLHGWFHGAHFHYNCLLLFLGQIRCTWTIFPEFISLYHMPHLLILTQLTGQLAIS
ncbi:mCG147262 [Mus musculus]|nr:mCG147262 [Mus musculus]